MADTIYTYKTTDGRTFDTESKARKHQDFLDGLTPVDYSLPSSDLASGEIIKLYNISDWKGIISVFEAHKSHFEFSGFTGRNVYSKMIYNIACAVVNDDYLLAFETGNYGNGYKSFSDSGVDIENGNIICQKAMEVGKSIWEKQNGRAMTDADLQNLQYNELENEILKWVNHPIDRWDPKIGTHDGINPIIYTKKGETGKAVIKWERATGRTFTKEDQIRIAGKPFPYDKDPWGDNASSSSSSTSDGTSIIIKILGAVIGAVIGGILLKFLPTWIAIIGGGVAGWFLGSSLKKKFIVIGAIAIVVLLFGKGIIGKIGNKTPKAQSTQTVTITQQADITQNVNFRKDPSTGDNIIRQLKKGDTVTLTGEVVEGWTQITHNGDTGWVSTEYLKVWGK